jgi:Secretory lipase
VGGAARAGIPDSRWGARRAALRAPRVVAVGSGRPVGAIQAVVWPRRGPPNLPPATPPELNIAGAVLGSPVANLGSVARRLNHSFFAGLAALMIVALTDVFPGAQRVVDEWSASSR